MIKNIFIIISADNSNRISEIGMEIVPKFSTKKMKKMKDTNEEMIMVDK